jgi:hypothetical protein
MKTQKFEETDIAFIRAWADAGIIPVSRYVEEVQRREQEAKAAESKTDGPIDPLQR